MKRMLHILKFVVLLALVVFLYSFTQTRNSLRKLKKVDIEFLDDNDPFVTLGTVNKLLIQNQDSITGVGKETLVLKEVESRLLENAMIRDAQVYVTVDGVLGAKIEQRNPLGRVAASPDYYIDEDGKVMPLSDVHAARVPIITGQSRTNFTEITPLLIAVDADEFMKKSVIGIHVNRGGTVELKFRKHDFDIKFGTLNAIARKFENFKAFYQKTKQDSTLNSYETIDLQFGNQVVATKKE
ncbi:MAG: cell division protein FtsQ/DivIB [Marinirhabdus sp.]|nr:cell division protein FtsQ/DivIB [Marinirhabdus sp.]